MTKPNSNILSLLQGYSRWFALCLLVLTTALAACSPSGQVGAGPQKKTRLSVGEIREIRIQGPADSTMLLSASSDNSEVVDVSQKQEVATPNGSARSATGERVFLLKGVTIGLARVVFSEKRSGETGDGQVRRTYVVQVVSR